MRVAVTGASGLIGSALVPHLRSVGHDVQRLVRRAPSAPDEIQWDPVAGTVDLDALQGVDGVVHLAGAGVGDHRWTTEYRQEILSSRVDGTATIAKAMAALDPKPRVLVSASAIGWYGDTGDREVDETAPAGSAFLSDVVRAWEAAAEPAAAAGIRVVHPRTGLVVAGQDGIVGPLTSVARLAFGGHASGLGGAFGPLIPLVRLGVGGRLGSGKQYWSWISLRDEVCALQFLLEQDQLSGPVNLTGPVPVTQAAAVKALGAALNRPTVLPVPSFALRAALGEFSTEILGSARVRPRVLEDAGFAFQDPTIESALRTALAGT